MNRTTVDLNAPGLYEEPDSSRYRRKRRLTLLPMVKLVRRYAGSGDFSLLEVGTGAGYFLSFLEAEFPRARLTGIEWDPRLVASAREKVRQARILRENAETFRIPENQFDMIVSLQVIEHLFHPEAMLAAVKSHLKPGGIFIFTTPNLSGWGARLMKEKWHGFRKDHVSLKGFQEWRELVMRFGFAPLYCGSTFFSGIPILNQFPLGVVNWSLLFWRGSARWERGEAFVGVFRLAASAEAEACRSRVHSPRPDTSPGGDGIACARAGGRRIEHVFR